MGITIEITTSNNVTRKCTTTIFNTANGALTSGISAFGQLLVQIFNNIFVCNILHFCCIRNPTQAITILSGALYSANVKLVKTTFLIQKLQSQSLSQITLLGRVQPRFTKLVTVSLLLPQVLFYNSSCKSLITSTFLIFYFFVVFEIEHKQ